MDGQTVISQSRRTHQCSSGESLLPEGREPFKSIKSCWREEDSVVTQPHPTGTRALGVAQTPSPGVEKRIKKTKKKPLSSLLLTLAYRLSLSYALSHSLLTSTKSLS